MSSVEVRLFRRDDRDQLTELVNAHAAAVVPGVSVAVNAVLSQLEREPGEFIVDPWVVERLTLVAEQRRRVVAAAHLLRYGAGLPVGESYRASGEIRWFLCWPEAPFWPDAGDAADALIGACVGQLERWGVARQYADGTLPAPGVYGLPEQWPHVRATLERAGFVHDGHTEILLVAAVGDLPEPGEAPIERLTLSRSLGINGTRLSALLDGELVGFIEVDTNLGEEGRQRLPRLGGWADIGNLHVVEQHRRRGVAIWLVGHAAAWLRLAEIGRLLTYAGSDDDAALAFFRRAGFRELTRTQRGWARSPQD